MKRGWWKLEITGVFEPNEYDLRHIANCIIGGCNQGEIIQEEPQCDLCGEDEDGCKCGPCSTI